MWKLDPTMLNPIRRLLIKEHRELGVSDPNAFLDAQRVRQLSLRSLRAYG